MKFSYQTNCSYSLYRPGFTLCCSLLAALAAGERTYHGYTVSSCFVKLPLYILESSMRILHLGVYILHCRGLTRELHLGVKKFIFYI